MAIHHRQTVYVARHSAIGEWQLGQRSLHLFSPLMMADASVGLGHRGIAWVAARLDGDACCPQRPSTCVPERITIMG